MSYYRDDREAARQRIDALEAKLQEQDAALHAQRADLAEREEEIARLRDVVAEARGHLPRRGIVSLTTVWAARSVGVALLMCSAMGGAGFLMATPPDPAVDQLAFVEERQQVLVDDTEEHPGNVMIHDRAPADPSRVLDEYALMRSLEEKAWGGQATVDELRTLRALCTYYGDLECKVRASSLLPDKP